MQLCSECVEDFLKNFLENAKEVLQSGEFFPIAIPIEFKDDDFELKDSIPLMFKDDSDKITVLLDTGAACWFEDVEDIIIIMNGCGRRVDDFEKFQENYETERPSLYPESMRDEYLILSYVDLIDEDFKMLTCKYKKVGNEIIFEEPIFTNGEGAISGIVEFIVQGYNLMHRFLSDNDEDSENEDINKQL